MTATLNLSADGTAQPIVEGVRGSVFDALLYTVFQKPRDPELGGVVVAIGASNPCEGSTFVARALLQELGRSELNSVAGVNMSFLRKLHEPTLEAIKTSLRATGDGSGREGRAISRRRGAFGAEGLDRLISERTRHQLKEYRARMRGRESLEERVVALAAIRREQGYMAEWSRASDGTMLLVENHCPICAAASAC